MFNLIKRLPAWAIILVGVFFAYGNLTGMEYWIKWKYVWPFLVIAFGIWKWKSELKNNKKQYDRKKRM